MRIARGLTLAAGVLLLAAGAVHAQEKFPNKPIRTLVGFAPGTVTDILARTVGQKMSENWGQPVVVDNRPGAGGMIASEMLTRATPDGHTLIMVSIGHAAHVSLYSKLPYDTLKDFAGVTLVADVPIVLVIAPNVPAKSVPDLIALAKSKPGQYNFGSVGVGSGSHLAAEMFKSIAGIDIVHIPFKMLGDVFPELLGGRVHLYLFPVPAAMPMLKEGRLRPLAVASLERAAALPDVPTTAEAGLPGFDYSLWNGLLAPGKTPKGLKEKLAKEVARILALQDVKERLLTQGATPHPTSPEESDAFIRNEVARMAKVIKEAGIKAQ